MKSISVCKINHMLFFKGFSISTEKWSFKYGPILIGTVNDGHEALGNLCLKTFNECKINIPHPEDTRSLKSISAINPFKNSEEEKLIKKLKNNNNHCLLDVSFDGKRYSFLPHKITNKSVSLHLYEKTIETNGDPENLGKTLLQAFELCE